MPGFDGTGPRGAGPMTGRGMGYCAMPIGGGYLPAYGYAGIWGYPLNVAYPYFRAPFFGRYRAMRPGRGFGMGRGRGRGFRGRFW